ncbi:MAG: hypothetical protein ACRYG7_37860 [Janthinobacterium lividum]
MNLPFLRHLPGLGRQPLHRIVAATGATTAEAALQHLLAELPELLLAAVVATDSGQVLASYTSQPQLKPSSAAPFWVASVRQLQASQAAQQQAEEQPEEVLTTLHSQLHLLRLQPGGQYFLYLAADARDTNLALAREVMRQAIDLLITS